MIEEQRQDASPIRTTGRASATLLERLATQKRRSLSLAEDEGWLRDITPHPSRLVNRMVKRGLLYRVGKGKYVVAPPGSNMKEQAASDHLLADVILRSYGPYYLAHLTAMIDHRLTDLHSEMIFVAMPQDTKPRQDPEGFKIAGYGPAYWPDEESAEIERIRAAEGIKEFFYRSTLERTLIDGLLRPDLCAGIETVVTAWGRALDKDTSWNNVAQISKRLGPTTSRRVAFLLCLLGKGSLVGTHFADLNGRTSTVLFDRSNGFNLEREHMERDPRTGVLINVPLDYLTGWIGRRGD